MSIVPRILQVSVIVFSCSRTSQSILFVLVFGSGFFGCQSACHWSSLLETIPSFEASSRRAQRAEVQVSVPLAG